MDDFFYMFLSSKLALQIQVVLAIPITILVLVLFFIKSSRDERGRAIVGRASIISTIYFMIIMNVVPLVVQQMEVYITVSANVDIFIYNTVLLIEGLGILILKKIN